MSVPRGWWGWAKIKVCELWAVSSCTVPPPMDVHINLQRRILSNLNHHRTVNSHHFHLWNVTCTLLVWELRVWGAAANHETLEAWVFPKHGGGHLLWNHPKVLIQEVEFCTTPRTSAQGARKFASFTRLLGKFLVHTQVWDHVSVLQPSSCKKSQNTLLRMLFAALARLYSLLLDIDTFQHLCLCPRLLSALYFFPMPSFDHLYQPILKSFPGTSVNRCGLS